MKKDFENIILGIEEESDNDSVNKKALKHMKKKDYEYYKKKYIIEVLNLMNLFQIRNNYLNNKKKYIIKKNNNGENLDDDCHIPFYNFYLYCLYKI